MRLRSVCCRKRQESRFLDCMTYRSRTVRNFSLFSSRQPEIHFPVPNSRAEKELMVIEPQLSPLLSQILASDEVLKLNKAPYTVADLPPFPDIPLETVDNCYLVYYKDPWNLFMILNNEGLYQYQMDNPQWRKFFPKQDPMIPVQDDTSICFKSSLSLFRGLIIILSWIIQKIKKTKEILYENYEVGDLVICAVPRKKYMKRQSSETTKVCAYRGVVVQQLNLSFREKNGIRKKNSCKYLCVYLLDTGEFRCVQTGVGYLAPLPEAFIGFSPMAIHCALHGVSPVGPQWSEAAKRTVKRLLCLWKLKGEVETTAEFISKAPSTNNFLGSLKHVFPAMVYSPPVYFVEVTSTIKVKPPTQTPPSTQELDRPPTLKSKAYLNVSTEIIRKSLALEWNMFPMKPEFCREYFQPWDWKKLKGYPVALMQAQIDEDAEPEKIQINTDHRGILHVCQGGNHKKFPRFDKVETRRAIRNAFISNPTLDTQLIKLRESTGKHEWKDNTLALYFNVD